MKHKVLIVIGILSIVLIAFFIGRELGKGTYVPEEKNTIDYRINTDQKVTEFFRNRTSYSSSGININCSNLDLELTSLCLNYYVRQFFKYNLTDDSISLNEYELKTRGGDCKDYTDFYEKEFLKYGYETQRIRFNVRKTIVEEGVIIDEGLDHVLLLAKDGGKYCIMDLNQFHCFD